MSENDDEIKFVKAYEEGVDFKNFDSSALHSDYYKKSSFSLIRQIAQKSDNTTYDLNGNPVSMGADSVMDLIHGRKETEELRVNISDAARPLRNRSSIHAFLKQNEEPQFEPDKIQPQYEFTSKDHTETVAAQSTQSASFDAPKAYDPKTKYSSLFKSSHQGEYTTDDITDSLQEIYKRLLKCQ